jgi:ATP-dependent RNA helicase SUPV3L1/SUV3
VAVIDEIQMISDEKRGYAWTKALNGLRAREVHVCGGLEAANIVRTIAATNNDDFELHTYKRLTELKVADHSLHGDYSTCRPGDCIVAFSKAEIFAIKKEIEKLSAGLKCAVIYGQLPPETRSLQARMFNEGTLDILVASDAIGMGLNLNIRRIIFHSVHKRGNDAHAVWLNPSAVKQIAGRAGRLSSQYKFGEVTTWQERDLAYVRAVCDWDIPDITTVSMCISTL